MNFIKILIILFSNLLMFGCNTSSKQELHSAWEVIHQSAKVDCRPINKPEEVLGFKEVHWLDENEVLIEGFSRTGSSKFLRQRLRNNTEASLPAGEFINFGSKNKLLAVGTIAGTKLMAFAMPTEKSGSYKVGFYDFLNDQLLYESKDQPLYYKIENLIFDQNKVYLTSLDTRNDSLTRYVMPLDHKDLGLLDFDKQKQSNILDVEKYYIYEVSPDKSELYAVSGNLFWIRNISNNLKPNKNSKKELHRSKEPIDLWDVIIDSEKIIFAYIEGDSLTHFDVKMHLIAYSQNEKKLLWSKQEALTDIKIGNLKIIKDESSNISVAMNQWIDGESTLAVYEWDNNGDLVGKSHHGSFSKPRFIRHFNLLKNNSDNYYSLLIREKDKYFWNFEHCLIKKN